MLRVFPVFCLLLFAPGLPTVKGQSTAAKQKPKYSPAKSTPAARGSAKKVSTTRRSKGKRRPAPSYQQHPDPERYKEIQQALADKGFFKGNVNGVWGDDSIDALKRFQVSQNITEDGKIGALSLAGLGLGPKHEANPLRGPAIPPATSAPSGGVAPAAVNPLPSPVSGETPPHAPPQ